MPELPEVENIAVGLREAIISLSIKNIDVAKPLIIRGPHQRRWRKAIGKYCGCKIVGVARRGKRLIMATNNGSGLVVQLGMTGRFVIVKTSEARVKHTHFLIKLNNNKDLRFVDPRRFGRVWLVDDLDLANPDIAMGGAGMSPMGPEPFDITRRAFRQLLGSKRVIKSLLLDQVRIAGLGNIYADEALFGAGIHPAAVAEDICPEKAEKLRIEIRKVLRQAIKGGGTTFSDFRNAYGEMGQFIKKLRVYQRTGLSCGICDTAIERIVISGRSSHFCPKCQVKNRRKLV